MDITYMKEFMVLSKVCNYKMAAEELFISQTTLFNHIKALENEFGVALFERAGKRIRLSKYGEMFRPYARVIIGNAENFLQEVSELQKKSGQKIKIGSQYRITNLIRQFKEQHDSYMIYDVDAVSAESALYQSDCDLAFIRDLDNADGRYCELHYCCDSLAVAVPRCHPLARRGSVSLAELKDEKFVLYLTPQGKESHEMIMCEKAGFRPEVSVIVANGSEAAKLVNAGVGITLLMKKSFRAHDDVDVILLDVDPLVTSRISICWRKDTTLSEGAVTFIDYIKNTHDYSEK